MTTYNWVVGSGSFDNANNWSNHSTGKIGDGVPGPGDVASFPDGGTDITLADANTVADSVTEHHNIWHPMPALDLLG
jgi:hypothetical protein